MYNVPVPLLNIERFTALPNYLVFGIPALLNLACLHISSLILTILKTVAKIGEFYHKLVLCN